MSNKLWTHCLRNSGEPRAIPLKALFAAERRARETPHFRSERELLGSPADTAPPTLPLHTSDDLAVLIPGEEEHEQRTDKRVSAIDRSCGSLGGKWERFYASSRKNHDTTHTLVEEERHAHKQGIWP